MSDVPAGAPQASQEDLQAVQRLKEAHQKMRDEIGKVIVGQGQVVDEVLISLFCRGHCLLIGVPGLAKTMLIRTLSEVLDLDFSRIQFTPDLMPSDITGTEIIQEDKQTGQRVMRFVEGPIFANIILADEINRTPPKTQAALLESMQEYQVTAAGQKYQLKQPFFVLATQNPIEQEGTYPLPEAQLDRFMFNIMVDYPTEDEEFEIARMTTGAEVRSLEHVLTSEDIMHLQEIVRRVPVAEHVIRYAMKLVRATRVTTDEAPQWVKEQLSWGAGPRAVQYLILGGKARAILHGRYYVSNEDIETVALPVLRHRIITNFNAEAEGIRPDDVIKRLIDEIPANDSAALSDKRMSGVLGGEGEGQAARS
jgi:MoxR-like ATPase